jgi:hypothetical protein
MASLASDVYGSNMTRGQARRMVSRSHVVAPRATSPRSSALRVTAAVECNECGTATLNGRIVGREWLCLPCAIRGADGE